MDLEAAERAAVQSVARVMREAACRLPAESAVGAQLEAGAERVLRLLSPPHREPGQPSRRLMPTIPAAGTGLLFGGVIAEWGMRLFL